MEFFTTNTMNAYLFMGYQYQKKRLVVHGFVKDENLPDYVDCEDDYITASEKTVTENGHG